MTIVQLCPITLICFFLKAEYENTNSDSTMIRQYLSNFDMSANIWCSSVSLISDDHVEVDCSLLSVPAQNDGLVLVIPAAPVARVAECRSPLQGSERTRI